MDKDLALHILTVGIGTGIKSGLVTCGVSMEQAHGMAGALVHQYLNDPAQRYELENLVGHLIDPEAEGLTPLPTDAPVPGTAL